MNRISNNCPPKFANNPSSQKHSRYKSLDAVAGILMSVVILLHGGLLRSEPFSVMHVLGFFMPWFFFKAGMFQKQQKLSKKTLLKYLKRYVVPALFCVLLTTVYGFLYNRFMGGGADYYPDILWFIEALLISKVLFDFVPDKKAYYIVIAVIAFVISDIISRCNFDLPLILKETPMALFYMATGFLLKDIQYVKSKQGLYILLLVVVYALFIVLIPSKVDMRLGVIRYGLFEIAVFGNVAGIVLINNIAKIVEDYVPGVILYIGRESMSYYVLHMLIMSSIGGLLLITGMNHDSQSYLYIRPIAVFFVVPLIICLLVKIKLSWLLGK